MGYKLKSVTALNKKLNELGIINKLRNNSWDISHQYDYCIEEIVVFKGRQIYWKPQGINLIINAIELDKWNLPLFEYNYSYKS